MDEVLDTITGGAIWGLGFGLAMTAVRAAGAGARGAGGGLRPLAKNIIKGALTVGSWVQTATAEGRETIEDVYHEAQAERRAETRNEAPARTPARSRRKEQGAEA